MITVEDVIQKQVNKSDNNSLSSPLSWRLQSSHPCTSLSLCNVRGNVEIWLQRYATLTTLQKVEGKWKGAKFSDVFQGFCLRLQLIDRGSVSITSMRTFDCLSKHTHLRAYVCGLWASFPISIEAFLVLCCQIAVWAWEKGTASAGHACSEYLDIWIACSKFHRERGEMWISVRLTEYPNYLLM